RVSGFPFDSRSHNHGHGDEEHYHISNHRWIAFRTEKINYMTNLEYLFRHELGHILGLKHPWDEMNSCPFKEIRQPGQTERELQERKEREFDYTIMGYSNSVKEWQPADILALQHLYGRPGQAAPAQIAQRRGDQPEAETAVVDRQPSIFAFRDGVTGLLTTEKRVTLVEIGQSTLTTQTKIVILDDGRGENTVSFVDAALAGVQFEFQTGLGGSSFQMARLTLQVGQIVFTSAPTDYEIRLSATGTGPAPRSLQVQLVTFEVNGTLKTGQSVTVELGIDAPATYRWYLQHHGAGGDGVLVSRAASFTPIEPGEYRLVLKVEGVSASASRFIEWSAGGQDEISESLEGKSGTAGDNYLLAANYLWEAGFGLRGRAGDDVLVAGPHKAVMFGGYAYSLNGNNDEYDPGKDVFLVYRGLSRFTDKAREIADFVPTHDKIGLGYEVTRVWYKQTDKGIYLLNEGGEDARIYALIAFDNPFADKKAQSIISGVAQLQSAHFDVLGQTVTIEEYQHDVFRKNQLHHWVVDDLQDEGLVTLRSPNGFNSTPTPGSRHHNLEDGYLIDLGDARQVWFDVRDVNDDEKPDTILYKTEDRSKIFGVLDDYDGRAASHSDYALNADFFVDNTITVTDLDII
ncbi:MAG: hypothetical protein ACPHO7_01965, partial [Candidatus Puniceispirillaceae bacterium]